MTPSPRPIALQLVALQLVAPLLVAALAAATLSAQDPHAAIAYPERDVLSPFRAPAEIVAPEPEIVFTALRAMRRIAETPGASVSFDADGREVVDDPEWQRLHREVQRIGLDAGVLAGLMRKNRDGDLRDLAFYAAFHCTNIDYVCNLIGHIPGEPMRATREKAYPRAIEFLRAHLGRTFGSLSKEQQDAVTASMPEPGSPAAQAKGITRMPRAEDLLFGVNLKPFFQLLDLEEPADQAQALWFLAQCFEIRRDLAEAWLEPALPRVRQLLLGDHAEVRAQALLLLGTIAPADAAVPAADADREALEAFADAATRATFPPIRRISDGVLLLLPSADRDAIAAAGRAALTAGGIGEATFGKTPKGQPYRGLRIERMPAELEVLGIPLEAIVTAVNGVPINDAGSLLRAIEAQFRYRDRSEDRQGVMRPLFRRDLLVELLIDGETRLFEYRIR
ncbi:MAG: hypothetical protein AB7O97_13985 [Planctomycetota bacterium]